jgi:hypothetical protein
MEMCLNQSHVSYTFRIFEFKLLVCQCVCFKCNKTVMLNGRRGQCGLPLLIQIAPGTLMLDASYGKTEIRNCQIPLDRSLAYGLSKGYWADYKKPRQVPSVVREGLCHMVCLPGFESPQPYGELMAVLEKKRAISS